MTFTKPNGKRRVVVTGAGMLSALGRNWDEAYEKLKEKKNLIKHMQEWEHLDKMNTKLACPYTEELPKFPRKKIRGMGRVGLLSLVATDDALKMAGLLDAEGNAVEEIQNGRTGIAYGCCMGSMEALSDMIGIVEHGDFTKVDSQTYIKCMPQTCAANLSIYYQVRGRVIVTDTACTSSSQAIGYSYEAIADGRQDMMIAGGADELSAADSAIFDIMGAASARNSAPETSPAAWDKNRDGLVIGEGAGSLILEDLEHAIKRGAKIYAEVVGFGTNMDGTHITSPNSETQAVALELAIEDAGIKPEEISYINAHGTATAHGDISESKAVYKVFGRAVPISTTKGYIGHTLGACGAIESWLTISMMNEGWFHPNLNLSEVDPECAPLDYIMGDGRKIDAEYVMSNNFAFGGVNTSLIFKKWTNGSEN
ncbi:beta-ketoacyl-ACP synthase [Treponema sp.]|uniref:beta-ketoacyl-ACP synthase n=1 Tax=Treponema sp. TaxID=166 RepID=UPI00298DA87E|nr:beta-ketoacyl-ACP synthase [Treponema sp.]MCQ2241378.1 beta-ketoacyl-ACP synthase [Treponema sp.]